MLEHDRPEPASLLIVADREGDFGFVVSRRPVVAGDADELAVDEGYEGEPVEIVDAGKARQLGLRQRSVEREE